MTVQSAQHQHSAVAVGQRVLVRGQQLAIPCVFMRGGTSRGAFLLQSDLPPGGEALDRVLLSIYGSPDARQIDGLGGAHPLTSKVAIIGPSTRPDADVDFTFGQVRVDEPVIDYDGSCGNMSAAVGPFAIEQGLVEPMEPLTRVRIHNTNTGQVFTADVPVRDGLALVDGDCEVPGVPGQGAAIWLDFADAGGSMTGGILPTGRRREQLTTVGGRTYVASLLDVSNPCVFVRAADLGLRGTELPDTFLDRPDLMHELEQIRGAAAMRLGFVADPSRATAESPAVPKMCLVAPPQEYVTSGGARVRADQLSLVARSMTMQAPHPAYQVTGATCTAVAALLAGTVVAEVARHRPGAPVRIGHASGIMRIDAIVEDGPEPRILRAAQERTARRIMDGYVYVPLARAGLSA
jgi:2-methylaconitate cis-trans-isomerase PrpF